MNQHVIIAVTDLSKNTIRLHNEAVRKKIQRYEKKGTTIILQSATSSISPDNKLITTVLIKEMRD